MLEQFRVQGIRLFGNKVDGVVETAHFKDDELIWVRAYERRGPTWSDHVLLNRETLVARIKAGKKFFVGSRIENNASEFNTGERIVLQNDMLVTVGVENAQQDTLLGLPII